MPSGGAPSSPLRFTAGRWLGIYPTITALLLLLGPVLLGHYPTPLIALFLTALLVPMTHYVVFPLVERLTGGWVHFPARRGAPPRGPARLGRHLPSDHRRAAGGAARPGRARPPIPVITLAVTLIAVPIQSLVILPRLMPRARPWILGAQRSPA